MTPTPKITAAERAHVIKMARQGKPLACIVRKLGLPRSAVRYTYYSVVKTENITRKRPTPRLWTAKDVAKLKFLVGEGYGYADIADMMDRTESSIRNRCFREGCPILRDPRVMSATDVAAMLGFARPDYVLHWIAEGWLIAQNARSTRNGGRPLWRIQRSHLYDFLRDHTHWMEWHPDAITDPDLRTFTTNLRRGKPRWLTVDEIADRYRVSPTTVRGWVYRNVIPSVKCHIERGRRYVWEPDLDTFVPLCERDRRAA